jgi:hypothetical protein
MHLKHHKEWGACVSECWRGSNNEMKKLCASNTGIWSKESAIA